MTDTWRILRACADRESVMLRATPVADWPYVIDDAAWHRRLCLEHGRYVAAATTLRYHLLARPA